MNTQPSDLESDALPLRHGVHGMHTETDKEILRAEKKVFQDCSSLKEKKEWPIGGSNP